MPTLTTPTTVTFTLEVDQILTLTNNFGAGRVVLSAQKGGDVVFDYTNNQLQNAPIFSSGSQGLVTITHLSGSLTYNVSASAVSGATLSANSFTGTQTITPPVGSSALVVASTIQTTSQPVLNLAQTWNAGAVTFTGMLLNVTDTASASGSLLLDLQVGGSSRFSVMKTGRIDFAGALLGGSTSSFYCRNNNGVFALGSSDDVVITRDAANTLAQRNGTAAQTFRVYNTFTDSSNGEWGAMQWVSNVLQIGSFANGTGTVRNINIAGGKLGVGTATPQSALSISGGITVGSVYAGTLAATDGSLQLQQDITFAGSTAHYISTASVSAPIVVRMWNGSTDLEVMRFQQTGVVSFGGATSSFPALKRSSAAMHVRLADDSAFADLVYRIPTSNPGPGTLWNNAGVLTIGT